MTELPIERDLRDALSVDPSPSFAAGVRARIAAEPGTVGRRSAFRMWMPAAVAALAAAALVVAVRTSHPPAAGSARQLLAGRSMVSTTTLPSTASSFVRQDAPVVARSRAREAREPDVVISASESRALLKLIAGPRTWQLDPAPVAVSTAPPVADLVIEPIVITPLSVDGGQGVRQ
jgi:hypothetical protein